MSSPTAAQRPELKKPSSSTRRIKGDKEYDLQHQAMLSDVQIERLKNAARSAAARFLALDLHLHSQDQDSVQTAVAKVVEECEFLEDYEEHWPVHTYLTCYLRWKICGDRKEKARRLRAAQGRLPKMKHTPRRTQTAAEERPAPVGSSRKSPTLPPDGTRRTYIGKPPPGLGTPGTRESATPSTTARPSIAPKSLSSTQYMPYIDDSSQAILSFINTLPIRLDSFFPFLINQRLRTMSDIYEFARWKGLAKFLESQKADGRLSALECTVLCEGFRELAEK